MRYYSILSILATSLLLSGCITVNKIEGNNFKPTSNYNCIDTTRSVVEFKISPGFIIAQFPRILA